MFGSMRKLIVAALFSAFLPLASCNLPEKEKKPVPPPTQSSQIPWNQPIPGQGGGAMGAMPKTPRR